VVQTLPTVKGEEIPKRKVDDMVEEILNTVRGLAFMMQKREEVIPSFFSGSISDLLESKPKKAVTEEIWEKWVKAIDQEKKGAR
jgi:hypothetical protein